MGKPELFSYLSAFVTIVLAVALGDMVQSTHRLIRARSRVKWDWLPLAFAALTALFVVSEFFSLWSKFDVAQISFARMIWLLAIPTLFALLAYSVLPDEIPADGIDLTEFYFSERRTWIVIFAIALVLDMVRISEVWSTRPGWFLAYAKFIGPMIAGTALPLVLMWVAKSRRWQGIGVAGVIVFSLYAILRWTIKAKTGA